MKECDYNIKQPTRIFAGCTIAKSKKEKIR